MTAAHIKDDGKQWNGPYLAGAGHLQAVHRSGDLDALDLAVLAALVLDVLYDLLILVIIQQLLGGHHVHQTQHLGGQATHLSHRAVHTRHLQRHWGLIYTRLQGQTGRLGQGQWHILDNNVLRVL